MGEGVTQPVIALLVLILIALAVGALLAPTLAGRRDVSFYGSIVDFHRRLSNIALLRTVAPSVRVSTATLWDESSVIGTPPPTVRLIGPDGRPIEPPAAEEASVSAGRTVEPSASSAGGTAPASTQAGGSASPQTLRRRKLVFQTLLGAFGATFIVGLLPGLRIVLLVSLVCAVLLGVYVMLLRKIKLQSSIFFAESQASPVR